MQSSDFGSAHFLCLLLMMAGACMADIACHPHRRLVVHATRNCRCLLLKLLPPLLEPAQQIRLEMLNIKQRMGELRGLHGRATLSRFDDTNEDELQVGGHLVPAYKCLFLV